MPLGSSSATPVINPGPIRASGFRFRRRQKPADDLAHPDFLRPLGLFTAPYLAFAKTTSRILVERPMVVYPSYTSISAQGSFASAPDKFRRPFGVEGLDPFPEIVRLAKAAVAVAFQLDRDRQHRILGMVQKFFGRARGKRRDATK